ncbi:unnamed protein product [Schistocephalus solidus]|uniref:Recep_L_domain domain-containing protein n=1 Tax=Schistocephalus solidus TaxID=70667 RepID=A0A183SH96_SCHSO|nr:unnamed protein product [Schistocephalus solidus]
MERIIAYSKTLMDVNIFGNEIGDLAARQLLEGLLLRMDAKLPKIGLKVSHQIHQDTFDAINQLAPGPKIKKKKRTQFSEVTFGGCSTGNDPRHDVTNAAVLKMEETYVGIPYLEWNSMLTHRDKFVELMENDRQMTYGRPAE